MENNIVIPTLEELINKNKEFYLSHPECNSGINISLLNEGINLISHFSLFYQYLKDKNFTDYELPYILFGELVFYIEKCYVDNNNNIELNNVFIYILELYKNGDKDIKDLVLVGFLENLDYFKGNLSTLLSKMPIDLINIIMKYYSDYLKL